MRPIAAYAIQGLACLGDTLLALDTIRGYLFQISGPNHRTTIFNPHHTDNFVDATGVAVGADTLWYTQQDRVYRCSLPDLTPELFVTLPYAADGITVWQSTVYVTCQSLGYILVFDAKSKRQITKLRAPGVGIENIAVRGEELWVCDRTEQSVYCMDRGTGVIHFSVLTPFESPTALAFYRPVPDAPEILYVAYAGDEAYIRDNPNANPSQELAIRDRTFIHPLYFQYYPQERYALSNGFLLEMSYVEELSPLDEVVLEDLEWRIALPSETDRQKVRQVEPIGLPFTEEIQDGQRVALFKFGNLKPSERYVFGWKALIEVWSIKYLVTPRQVENLPDLPPDLQERYLVDNDELAMDTEIIREAAKVAIGRETNLLRKVLSIRDYVYDHLSYGIKPHIDTPDIALARGVGSCGEYLGVLLALCRLNGIACRTVGRYKCPPYPDRPFVTLEPDFNHVWMEFYIPGVGWLPMESNPDDIGEGGPYPTRFFMGLSWYHTELGKGISFEKIKTTNELVDVSIGDLAINHVRFRILEELQPPIPH
ncbi:MAG: transglutaminase family protein [Leptolyngbyaceae bacterium]|nr:transglutaminase family protein [Leptolyngbyaceae bacterium]